MESVTKDQYDNLLKHHKRLLQASKATRDAMRAYYAYKPKSELDLPRKKELLDISKQKERELDYIIREELSGQTGLF